MRLNAAETRFGCKVVCLGYGAKEGSKNESLVITRERITNTELTTLKHLYGHDQDFSASVSRYIELCGACLYIRQTLIVIVNSPVAHG